jgi:hypothetical protein
MAVINLDTGLKTIEVAFNSNAKPVILCFNPTDVNFIERLKKTAKKLLKI